MYIISLIPIPLVYPSRYHIRRLFLCPRHSELFSLINNHKTLSATGLHSIVDSIVIISCGLPRFILCSHELRLQHCVSAENTQSDNWEVNINKLVFTHTVANSTFLEHSLFSPVTRGEYTPSKGVPQFIGYQFRRYPDKGTFVELRRI